MVGSSRLIRNIFGILSAWVLIVILISFANQSTNYGGYVVWGQPYHPDIITKHAHFHGFKEFFGYLETYPGLYYTQSWINNYCNVIGNFQVTNVDVLNALLAIFRILTTPIVIAVSIVSDIVHNIVWFYGFLNNFKW